jgi:hypothetical protein
MAIIVAGVVPLKYWRSFAPAQAARPMPQFASAPAPAAPAPAPVAPEHAAAIQKGPKKGRVRKGRKGTGGVPSR